MVMLIILIPFLLGFILLVLLALRSDNLFIRLIGGLMLLVPGLLVIGLFFLRATPRIAVDPARTVTDVEGVESLHKQELEAVAQAMSEQRKPLSPQVSEVAWYDSVEAELDANVYASPKAAAKSLGKNYSPISLTSTLPTIKNHAPSPSCWCGVVFRISDQPVAKQFPRLFAKS